MTLAELQKEAKRVFALIEASRTKLDELEGKEEKDEGAIKAAKAVYEEHKATFDGLQGKVEEAKEHQARIAMKREIDALLEPEDNTTVPAGQPDTRPAQAKDLVKQEQELTKLFTSYVQGKALSDVGRDALKPKSPRLQEGEAGGSVVIPERLTNRIMGSSWMYGMGKTIFSTATPAGFPGVTNPSAAQNLVPQEWRNQMQMLPFESMTVLDLVTIVPSTTGTVTWPALVQTQANLFGGVAFQWLGEGAEKPETEPEFEQREIVCHELAGYTEVSERALSRSAIQLEAFLARLFRGAMRRTLDTVILTGSGAGQPQGIAGTAGINLVTRTTANQVSDRDLVNLKHAVLPDHRPGASYQIHDQVEQFLELTVDTLGRPLFRASTANGPYDRLCGYPYVVGTNLNALGTSGDVIYGNLSHYILVMEEEITLARSEHAKFRENKIAFKVFAVIGGRLMEPLAFSILSDATS